MELAADPSTGDEMDAAAAPGAGTPRASHRNRRSHNQVVRMLTPQRRQRCRANDQTTQRRSAVL